MSETYCVRLDKESHGFSAAHFITYDGGACEHLHGHNYRVAVEVEAALDENAYVVDFIALGHALKAITAELDHRVLLPTHHPRMCMRPDEREVEVVFDDRRWVFPRSGCCLLPVTNTTAELLACYIGQRLLEVLQNRLEVRPRRMRVAIDENHGQWAVWEWGDA